MIGSFGTVGFGSELRKFDCGFVMLAFAVVLRQRITFYLTLKSVECKCIQMCWGIIFGELDSNKIQIAMTFHPQAQVPTPSSCPSFVSQWEYIETTPFQYSPPS